MRIIRDTHLKSMSALPSIPGMTVMGRKHLRLVPGPDARSAAMYVNGLLKNHSAGLLDRKHRRHGRPARSWDELVQVVDLPCAPLCSVGGWW
jgi:hypothetical protein